MTLTVVTVSFLPQSYIALPFPLLLLANSIRLVEGKPIYILVLVFRSLPVSMTTLHSHSFSRFLLLRIFHSPLFRSPPLLLTFLSCLIFVLFIFCLVLGSNSHYLPSLMRLLSWHTAADGNSEEARWRRIPNVCINTHHALCVLNHQCREEIIWASLCLCFKGLSGLWRFYLLLFADRGSFYTGDIIK